MCRAPLPATLKEGEEEISAAGKHVDRQPVEVQELKGLQKQASHRVAEITENEIKAEEEAKLEAEKSKPPPAPTPSAPSMPSSGGSCGDFST